MSFNIISFGATFAFTKYKMIDEKKKEENINNNNYNNT